MTERDLQAQVARLKTIPRSDEQPWGKEGEPGLRDELLRVLRGYAESIEHARAIVDQAIGASKFCPTPFELAEIAEKVVRPSSERKSRATECCTLCMGSGFQIVERNGYSGAKPCECRTLTV